MPSDLGKLFEANFRGIPPHMSVRDYKIWARWHALNYQDFLGWYFDAAVGVGGSIPENTPPRLARHWTRLTQKRIDAIGIKKDAIWILEVRDSAGSSAMGALLTYMHLIRDDNPFSLPLKGAIITDHADKDFKQTIAAFGLQVIEI